MKTTLKHTIKLLLFGIELSLVYSGIFIILYIVVLFLFSYFTEMTNIF